MTGKTFSGKPFYLCSGCGYNKTLKLLQKKTFAKLISQETTAYL